MEETKNLQTQESQTYVPASVKVIEVTSRGVLCISGNENYGDGNTDGWYNN